MMAFKRLTNSSFRYFLWSNEEEGIELTKKSSIFSGYNDDPIPHSNFIILILSIAFNYEKNDFGSNWLLLLFCYWEEWRVFEGIF